MPRNKEKIRIKTSSRKIRQFSKKRLSRKQCRMLRLHRHHQNPQSSQEFNVEESIVDSPVNTEGLIVYPTATPHVRYILVTDLQSSYELQSDLCGHLSLVPFTKWAIFCEGYQAKAGETLTISTCFRHRIFIRFTDYRDFNENQKNNLINLDEFDFLEQHLPGVLIGDYVLLKFESIPKSMAKYRLVLEYLSKSSNEKARQICRKKLSTMSDKDHMNILSKISNIDFEQCTLHILKIFHTLKISNDDVILVYGQANCGKTSLLHYLINQYLNNRNQPVAYLECDPGQPEFAPCGILSLVEINGKISNALGYKFLFNENHVLNDDERIKSKIFGTITPSGNTFEYISLISQLYQSYRQMNVKKKRPLFINTMGWIEELGLELLTNIISIVRPTHIIRIENDSPSLSVSDSSMINIQNRKELERIFKLNLNVDSEFQDLIQLVDMKNSIGHQLWITLFPFISNFKPTIFSVSYLRREINQLLYLCSNLWPQISFKPFYSIQPIQIRMENLYIHFTNYPAMVPKSIYILLNVSWVFLGSLDPNEMNENMNCIEISSIMQQELPSINNQNNGNMIIKNSDRQTLSSSSSSMDKNIKLLHQLPKSAKCFGCGIIRNVDPVHSSIFVTISSIHHFGNIFNAEKNKINFLVIPNLIPIPSGLLVEQFLYQDSCHIPFVYIRS
ncbi:Polynucleotide 5'-hydroxyl-kinase nol9 [Dermatophagoides farinae]|uniref:Polynucleotide 5'-hydroxyl-kinase nol9 n=1 Tax=Dermatophagoides farinae TaxID=6954 RepID=A0A922LAD7_DERFA|nr:Polynucleotide 5'-hydroxyl-kinase nol9 [Dermatophagoides farinae]